MSYQLIVEVLFPRLLFISTFFCALVAGFLFAFSVVVMPGLKKLNDRTFIQVFQKIDGIIQDGQPLFIVVWLGSIAALIASVITGFSQLDSWNYSLLVLATLAYFFGVQVSTAMINIPLNNRLQKFDTEKASETELAAERQHFEDRWNSWNVRRTLVACAVTALLIAVV